MGMGLSRLRLGLTSAGGGGAAPFSPADLFAASEDGAWYDPSDLTSMNTLSDGTGSQPAVGDPVGRLEDKSGNANHALQATAANRPILRQTAGGEYYLEFDGVNDALTFTNDIVGTIASSAFCAFENRDGTTNNEAIFKIGEFTASNGSAIKVTSEYGVRTLGGNRLFTTSAPASAVVLSVLTPSSSNTSDISFYQNGAALSQASTVANTVNIASGQNSSIASGDEATFNTELDLYGLILVGADKSADRTDSETYLADKAGVTL